MKGNPNIALIILAAGASLRMGQAKQLLKWKETTLLGNAIGNAQKSKAKDIYVVLGAVTEGIMEKHQGFGVEWILNQEWKQGMGSSVAKAARHIQDSGKSYDGVLIMLCDQPLIDVTYLDKIIANFTDRKQCIVATTYKHGHGVPALFDSMYLEELTHLDKDMGARDIIVKHAKHVFGLDPEGKEKDLDTIEEYKALLKT